ncbi:MAG: XRE family transcriptional regulator [Clostridia bacterium]|nr:MAG: XRE family transcriptional regulator [Clostridia bacterium]
MNQEKIALMIKSIIKSQGKLQGPIAIKAGFTPSQFSNLLNGRKLMLAEYIPRIAKALGVTPNDILWTNRDKVR